MDISARYPYHLSPLAGTPRRKPQVPTSLTKQIRDEPLSTVFCLADCQKVSYTARTHHWLIGKGPARGVRAAWNARQDDNTRRKTLASLATTTAPP
jgi:hypothetical protein